MIKEGISSHWEDVLCRSALNGYNSIPNKAIAEWTEGSHSAMN